DLGSLSVQQLAEALEAAPNTAYPDRGSREALVHAIGQKAQASHKWGINIAREAQHHSIWVRDLWQPLISAWGTTDLSAEEWPAVLDIVAGSEAVYKNTAEPIASLLERGVRNATAPIPAALI